MKHILTFATLGLLAACASPTFNMTPEQVASLSDDQLCSYNNSYRSETKMDAEIARRGLNCDRYYRECLRRGNQPNTEAMNFCMDMVRENERLRYDRQRYDNRDVFGYGGYGHRGSGVGIGLGF